MKNLQKFSILPCIKLYSTAQKTFLIEITKRIQILIPLDKEYVPLSN